MADINISSRTKGVKRAFQELINLQTQGEI